MVEHLISGEHHGDSPAFVGWPGGGLASRSTHTNREGVHQKGATNIVRLGGLSEPHCSHQEWSLASALQTRRVEDTRPPSSRADTTRSYARAQRLGHAQYSGPQEIHPIAKPK